MKDERDLRQRTKHFALRIIQMFAALPKRTVAQVLGKQALRSGTSIGANYREAHRGRRKAEFARRDATPVIPRLAKRAEGPRNWSWRVLLASCRQFVL